MIEIRQIERLRGLLPVVLGGFEIELQFLFAGAQGVEVGFRVARLRSVWLARRGFLWVDGGFQLRLLVE